MARDIISGDAGTVWQNDTGKAKYQFVAALINTCGVCLQYHLKISANWPIPIHYNCAACSDSSSPARKPRSRSAITASCSTVWTTRRKPRRSGRRITGS